MSNGYLCRGWFAKLSGTVFILLYRSRVRKQIGHAASNEKLKHSCLHRACATNLDMQFAVGFFSEELGSVAKRSAPHSEESNEKAFHSKEINDEASQNGVCKRKAPSSQSSEPERLLATRFATERLLTTRLVTKAPRSETSNDEAPHQGSTSIILPQETWQ